MARSGGRGRSPRGVRGRAVCGWIAALALAVAGAAGCAASREADRRLRPRDPADAQRSGGHAHEPLEAPLREALDASREQRRLAWPPSALEETLAERGYLDARIRRHADSLWALDPGARWSGARLSVREEASGERAIDLPAGGRAELSAALGSAVGGLLADLADRGHPLARAAPRALRLEEDPSGATRLCVDLDLERGPLARVRRLAFASDGPTRPRYLERVVGWRGEELYSERRWRSARRSLLATGLFDEVAGPQLLVGPGEVPRAAAPETLGVEVRMDLRERRVNAASGLLGYANRAGGGEARRGRVSGYLDLQLGNLLGTGRAASLFWQALGRDHSRFEIGWREPFLWRFPVSADLALTHLQEDSLLADTRISADLAWKPGPDWRVRLGWARNRLVLGAEVDATLSRDATRFGVERAAGESPVFSPRGWGLEADLEQWRGEGRDVTRARLRSLGWIGGSVWLLTIEEQIALVAGPASLLRGDAFLLGGTASLRGSYEGEFRTWRHLVQRLEFGPRLDRAGGRVYLLCDLAWFARWQPAGPGLDGTEGGLSVRAAWGAGLRLQGRAGLMRLDYAVPDGESPLRGRLHLGIGGVF